MISWPTLTKILESYRSKISHLIPQEIPLSEPILNLHEFHGSFKFMAWTPSGNILQIQLSENDIHQELVWDSSEKKQYLGKDLCYFYDQKYSRILLLLLPPFLREYS